MPEGDTLFRAARTLHQALAGRTVLRFESVFPHLARIDTDTPIRGRAIEGVGARGKHLLIRFSGDLVLRTHLRMHGSWHLYRPGERWRRPFRDMRIVIGTDAFEAVAFNVPEAEFVDAEGLPRAAALENLGPDPLAADFDADEAVRRIQRRHDTPIADALLDQGAMAGIGNIFKSETLFAARISPFTLVRDLTREQVVKVVKTGAALLRADRPAAFRVYGRAGRPCPRCGTPISRQTQGPHARSTYWCEGCQPGVT